MQVIVFPSREKGPIACDIIFNSITSTVPRYALEWREQEGGGGPQPNPNNPTKCQVVVWAAAFGEGRGEAGMST